MILSNNDVNQIWLSMLATLERVAELNKEAIVKAVEGLDAAGGQLASLTSSVNAALAKQGELQEKLDELAQVRFQLERLKTGVDTLEAAAKEDQLSKTDTLWRVAVGFFALVSSGLGAALLALLLK